VAVKIKLKRMGKIREPYFRIVVADARTKRDGRAIEEIGKYHPKADPSLIEVNSDRAQHWLSVGAQPTDPVRKLLEVTGDWQRFKGLPGAEGTLKSAAPRTDKKETFAAALAETLKESGATTKGKGRAGAKAAEPKAGDAKADEAKAGDGRAKARTGKAERPARAGKADSAKAETAKADSSKADAKAEAKADAEAEKPASAASDETEPKAGAAKSGRSRSKPAAKAEEPAAKSEEPAAKSDEPAAKSEEPAAEGDEAAAAAEPASGD
jgi:small subunit ribosomal protein S16